VVRGREGSRLEMSVDEEGQYWVWERAEATVPLSNSDSEGSMAVHLLMPSGEHVMVVEQERGSPGLERAT